MKKTGFCFITSFLQILIFSSQTFAVVVKTTNRSHGIITDRKRQFMIDICKNEYQRFDKSIPCNIYKVADKRKSSIILNFGRIESSYNFKNVSPGKSRANGPQLNRSTVLIPDGFEVATLYKDFIWKFKLKYIENRPMYSATILSNTIDLTPEAEPVFFTSPTAAIKHAEKHNNLPLSKEPSGKLLAAVHYEFTQIELFKYFSNPTNKAKINSKENPPLEPLIDEFFHSYSSANENTLSPEPKSLSHEEKADAKATNHKEKRILQEDQQNSKKRQKKASNNKDINISVSEDDEEAANSSESETDEEAANSSESEADEETANSSESETDEEAANSSESVANKNDLNNSDPEVTTSSDDLKLNDKNQRMIKHCKDEYQNLDKSISCNLMPVAIQRKSSIILNYGRIDSEVNFKNKAPSHSRKEKIQPARNITLIPDGFEVMTLYKNYFWKFKINYQGNRPMYSASILNHELEPIPDNSDEQFRSPTGAMLNNGKRNDSLVDITVNGNLMAAVSYEFIQIELSKYFSDSRNKNRISSQKSPIFKEYLERFFQQNSTECSSICNIEEDKSKRLKRSLTPEDLVEVVSYPKMGRGLRARVDIQENSVVALYPIDVIDREKSSVPKPIAISDYGKQNASLDLDSFEDYDSEYAIGGLYKNASVLALPANPQIRDSHDSRLVGHLINDAETLSVAPETFLKALPKNKDKYRKTLFSKLSSTSKRINVKLESKIICEDGVCYMRMLAAKDIRKGDQLFFYYGLSYWINKSIKASSKLNLNTEGKRSLYSRILNFYNELALEWLEQYEEKGNPTPFWWDM